MIGQTWFVSIFWRIITIHVPSFYQRGGTHETGVKPTRPAVADQKNSGNFNAQLNKGGKNQSGQNIPNAAASNRGSARSG